MFCPYPNCIFDSVQITGNLVSRFKHFLSITTHSGLTLSVSKSETVYAQRFGGGPSSRRDASILMTFAQRDVFVCDVQTASTLSKQYLMPIP